MSTLAEIESAVAELPRPDQAELLRFVAAKLREPAPPAPARTGAELARLWSALPHLPEDEAAAFAHDVAANAAPNRPQPAPAWE